MRVLTALWLALFAAFAQADRIILIPLDSRPAAGQFAQMIGRMASAEVVMPPYETLGRFTRPGVPEAIMGWMERQSYDDVSAVVVSTDMIAYGGLIASRTNSTIESVAKTRLIRLEMIRRAHPAIPFYAFGSIMRLAPTATRDSSPWRLSLAKYAELTDRYARTKNPADFQTLRQLTKKIPPGEIDRYERVRQRNHHIQKLLIEMTGQGAFDYLTLGQDDARTYGPHVPETIDLKQFTSSLGIGGRVYFCEGVDQLASILLSRAMLRGASWVPRVRIVLSDPERKSQYASFESKPIAESLRDQILASGARPVEAGGTSDYDLFVNVPKRSASSFASFMKELKDDLDQGFPICVADINLGPQGTADPELFGGLLDEQRMMKLLAFAGWNTAGNTMGTAIPAANVYLLARRIGSDPLKRELAQKEFLLHRFVNDYAYHRYTRPAAYSMIEQAHTTSRDETGEPTFSAVEDFIRTDLQRHLERYFAEQFQGRPFFAGTKRYEVDSLQNVRISLPWPRAYEVRLEFSLGAKPAPQ